MVEDMGSSLMSARGYDSDAQCIGSPQHAGRMRALPRSPASRRIGLHDLIERSRERNDLEMWAGAKIHDQSSTPRTPLRDAVYTNATRKYDGALSSPYLCSRRHMVASPCLHSEMSSLASQTCPRDLFQTFMPVKKGWLQQMKIINNLEKALWVVVAANLVAHWAQYMGSNPNDYRAAPSASLARKDPGIMVSKTRHLTTSSSPETHPETRVPHLGDLDLSHRLAGTSMGSGAPSTNPSMLELPRANRYGPQLASQENFYPYEGSGTSTLVGSEPQKQAMHHQRDASSSTHAKAVTLHEGHLPSNR
ncbi:uncharacterized protein N7500_010985 [Penicillium coprophilum]|uniref:uncharacterized protein n=1 Tax=Penicillium coprophilum TaxID=36646 RepID=UPI0023A122B0|nr:uncharacterized protein N7500_010985 [Penicillium coprophilum]KAJ5150796.1 hypothetical protein N7500_010985 [Penicillium coprophilum]